VAGIRILVAATPLTADRPRDGCSPVAHPDCYLVACPSYPRSQKYEYCFVIARGCLFARKWSW
jgi:hypothetical protein